MKLSPEERLLARCAATGGAPDPTVVATLVSGRSFSWDRVMTLAHWHRIPGMLFAFLKESAPEGSVPVPDMAHLRDHYRHSAVRNLFIGSEFARIVGALHADGIETTALKGVALLGSVYRDPGVRQMADIDLLVRQSSAIRAQEIALGMGYEAVGTEAAQSRTQEVHRHLPKLVHRHRSLALEIHTHFVSLESPLRFDINSIWRHAKAQRLHGVITLLPAPEHMLLHLCLHFFLDRRFTSLASLRQLGDVAAVIGDRERPVDWDFFVSEVQRHGVVAPVFSVLSVASWLMDVNIPQQALDGLRPAGYLAKVQETFIKQRVLRPGALTATELVPHQSEYTFGALALSVYRRIAPDRRYLETHYGEEAVSAPARTRAKRLGEGAKRAVDLARSPLRIWQEVRVDRWLHSLSRDGASTLPETNVRRPSGVSGTRDQGDGHA